MLEAVLAAVVLAPIAVVATWGGAAWWIVRYGRRSVPVGSWDVIVVAGCRVLPDGAASPALRQRMRLAVDLWRAGVAPRILVSGGCPEAGVTEARAGWKVARAAGVPEAALLLEERAENTLENARFSAEITGPCRAVVVSSDYHVARCVHLFARSYPQVTGAGCPSDRAYRLAVREAANLVLFGVFGRVTRVSSRARRRSRTR